MLPRLAFCRVACLSMLVVWALASCARLGTEETSGVRPLSLAMSIKNVMPGQGEATKMSTDITLPNEGDFRGIQELYVIPFATESDTVVEPGAVRLGSQNVVLGSVGINESGLVPNNNSHLISSAFIPTKMNRVLTYGRTPEKVDIATKDSKHNYGVLIPEGLTNPSGSDDISFHLEPILATGEYAEVEATVDSLLDKLNVAMTLMKESKYSSIVSIFDAVKRENQVLACSYPSLDYLRNEIMGALIRIPFESVELVKEIGQVSTALSSFSTSLTAAGANFPYSYGIPEGAVGFWWNGKKYVRLINSVNIALVNPTSYCYPPSLWYYANSSIKTSNEDTAHKQYIESNENWEKILGYYNDGPEVTSFTQAVAIEDPLQYGVGMVEWKLTTPGGDAMNVVDGCPLTGIIIGDQRDVDFRFLPSGQSQGRFIYDNVVSGMKIGSTANSVQTLVLQTVDEAPVHFALEFKNTTGLTRRGQQGDILPWSKFYLAGVLDPSDGVRPQSSTETFRSVFSRDHKTVIRVKVTGLANAYNTVPDLRSPQLEIGVVAEMKWDQLTPQSLVLDF